MPACIPSLRRFSDLASYVWFFFWERDHGWFVSLPLRLASFSFAMVLKHRSRSRCRWVFFSAFLLLIFAADVWILHLPDDDSDDPLTCWMDGWIDRLARIWTPWGHSFAFARSELPWMANAVSAPPSSGCRSMLGARAGCSLTLLTSGTALVADLSPPPRPPLLPPPIYWHCKCKSIWTWIDLSFSLCWQGSTAS